LGTSLAFMLLSATLVGGGFFITPAAVTAFCKASLPRDAWSSGIAFYTVVFAVGMPIGPALAGAVADVTGSLFAGLAMSVGVLLVGAILASQQRVISRV
jgi:predicted MFS family arabinose efflux permease